MMKRAVEGEPLTLYGDGACLRDFIHIEDVIDAFLRAIVVPDVCDGSHYVIASGRGHTLADAYAMIAEVASERFQRRVDIVHEPEPADLHPIEKRNFVGNSHVFQKRTGWRPRFDLKMGDPGLLYPLYAMTGRGAGIMNSPISQTATIHVPPLLFDTVRDVHLLQLPRFAREDGEIIVAQAAQVPFAIARLFT